MISRSAPHFSDRSIEADVVVYIQRRQDLRQAGPRSTPPSTLIWPWSCPSHPPTVVSAPTQPSDFAATARIVDHERMARVAIDSRGVERP